MSSPISRIEQRQCRHSRLNFRPYLMWDLINPSESAQVALCGRGWGGRRGIRLLSKAGVLTGGSVSVIWNQRTACCGSDPCLGGVGMGCVLLPVPAIRSPDRWRASAGRSSLPDRDCVVEQMSAEPDRSVRTSMLNQEET